MERKKKPAGGRAWQRCNGRSVSGTEASGFDQAHLVAACRELTTLIALNDHATTRFHSDHPGTNPAEGGGLENLDDITGL